MAKCMGCGKTILIGTELGNGKLCGSCSGKIYFQNWRKREFQSMEELVNQKSKALQSAMEARFPQDTINQICYYFDEYISAGFYTCINGKAGQVIKIFSDYCVIYTKEADRSNIAGLFNKIFSEKKQPLYISEKDNIVNGVMKGKLLNTGIGYATAAILDNVTKEAEEDEKHDKALQIIPLGEYRINYNNISRIELKNSSSAGVIRFIPNGIEDNDYYSCMYFFFDTAIPFKTKKMNQVVNYAFNYMQDRIYQCNNTQMSPMNRMMPMNQMAPMNQMMSMNQMAPMNQMMPVNQMAPMNQMTTMSQMAPMNQTPPNNILAQNFYGDSTNKGILDQTHQEDMFEEIRRYKELLDEGIISEDEFNQKKKQLLGI